MPAPVLLHLLLVGALCRKVRQTQIGLCGCPSNTPSNATPPLWFSVQQHRRSEANDGWVWISAPASSFIQQLVNIHTSSS